MDIVNINPLDSFDYSENRLNSKLSGIKQSIDTLKNNSDKKFKDILINSYGGKFDEKTKDLAPKNAEEEKLLETVTELESLLVKQMYKSMRSTLNKENDMLYGGMTEDIFTDMLYDEYSLLTSKNSNLGLAKQMYEQLLPLVRAKTINTAI